LIRNGARNITPLGWKRNNMENWRKSNNQINDCNFAGNRDSAFLLMWLKFTILLSKILGNVTQFQESVQGSVWGSVQESDPSLNKVQIAQHK